MSHPDSLCNDWDGLSIAILRELENAYGEGSCLAADLAGLVDASTPKVVARLVRLRSAGWVDAWWFADADANGWTITNEAVQRGPHVALPGRQNDG